MSRLLVALCAGLSAVAMTASAFGTLARPVAKPKPAGSIRIVFQGSGQETVQDVQRHVTISENACTQRQTLNATVSLTWNVAWGRMRVSALHTAAGAPTHPTQVSASLGADRVRDGCDRPDQTPPDWFGSDRCDYPLVSVDAGSIFGARGRTGSVGIEVTAPRFALPPAAACPVNIRSDQY